MGHVSEMRETVFLLRPLLGVKQLRETTSEKTIQFRIDLRLLKTALLFSLPLLPHFLSRWIITASDRLVLERYVPLTDVGIYNVGYQIGSVLMLFAVAGNNSLIPRFGRLDTKSDSEIRKLARLLTYYILGLTSIGLGIALFSPEIIYILTPENYHRAVIIIPLMILSYLFMGLYCPAMNVLNLIMGDTRKVAVFTVSAAALNLGLNLLLIPKFGMIAAAASTAAAYMLLGLCLFISAQKAFPLPYEYRRFGIILATGFLTFFVGWNLPVTNLVPSYMLKLFSLLLFPLLLWLSGFFTQQEKKSLQELSGRVRQAFIHH